MLFLSETQSGFCPEVSQRSCRPQNRIFHQTPKIDAYKVCKVSRFETVFRFDTSAPRSRVSPGLHETTKPSPCASQPEEGAQESKYLETETENEETTKSDAYKWYKVYRFQTVFRFDASAPISRVSPGLQETTKPSRQSLCVAHTVKYFLRTDCSDLTTRRCLWDHCESLR